MEQQQSQSHDNFYDDSFLEESLYGDEFIDEGDLLQASHRKKMNVKKNLEARRAIENYWENKRLRKHMDLWLDNNDWE